MFYSADQDKNLFYFCTHKNPLIGYRKLNLMRKLLVLSIILFSFTRLIAQDSISIINVYWGQVVDLNVSPEQLKDLKYIKVHDTIKSRSISEVTKFRFMMQPVMQGDVKVSDARGPFFNDRMKTLVQNPVSGDRIIITEIYAIVGDEGERKIPAAAVLVVE